MEGGRRKNSPQAHHYILHDSYTNLVAFLSAPSSRACNTMGWCAGGAWRLSSLLCWAARCWARTWREEWEEGGGGGVVKTRLPRCGPAARAAALPAHSRASPPPPPGLTAQAVKLLSTCTPGVNLAFCFGHGYSRTMPRSNSDTATRTRTAAHTTIRALRRHCASRAQRCPGVAWRWKRGTAAPASITRLRAT